MNLHFPNKLVSSVEGSCFTSILSSPLPGLWGSRLGTNLLVKTLTKMKRQQHCRPRFILRKESSDLSSRKTASLFCCGAKCKTNHILTLTPPGDVPPAFLWAEELPRTPRQAADHYLSSQTSDRGSGHPSGQGLLPLHRQQEPHLSPWDPNSTCLSAGDTSRT